jgi:PGDYG protein
LIEFATDMDLARDPAAALYVKTETVAVVFATEAGALISREGPNHYAAGDALITGSTGDRWSVTRARFDQKYAPVSGAHGHDGAYRANPLPVHARQIPSPFQIARSHGGDLLRGNANDWLLQYALGDFGVVENARFQKVYRPQER